MDQADPKPTWRPNTCLRCGAELVSIGVDSFRLGGTTGGWKLVFGELAELGEGLMKMEIRVCNTCRGVDLRIPETETPTR